MKGKKIILTFLLTAVFPAGCAPSERRMDQSAEDRRETQIEADGMKTYVYAGKEVLQGKQKVPLILYLCGTGGDPEKQPVESGYEKLAAEEDVIVVSPDYNNAAAYSEVPKLVSLISYMKENYPVDETRVYSLGFSNGGAASVALTSEYPQLLAGIAAYGWMVDLKNKDNGYEMPFQLVQGTEEFMTEDQNGNPAIMQDEQEAVHSLLVRDHMISPDTTADYQKTPYWGYVPSFVRQEKKAGVQWTVNDYQKEGFTHPFVQFLLVAGADHRPHQEEAAYSWNFLKHFQRTADGRIRED